jgi:3-deoxy-D-manno-octulosonic-acid transferase
VPLRVGEKVQEVLREERLVNRFDLAYLAACVPAAPVLAGRFLLIPKYRHRFGERLGWFSAEDGLSRPVWFHAASVGEVNAAQALIESLHAAAPGLPIVMTTLTMSGRERAARVRGVRRFRYAPFDLEACVEQAFRRWRPRLLVVVEQEIWPNLFLAAVRHGVPVVVVNARLSERSLGWYRRARYSLRPVLEAVSRVLAQDTGAADRWRRLGVAPERVVEAGNLKFDLAVPDVDAAAVRRGLGIAPGAPVLVGGSTHAPEEEWLLEARGESRLILAPRYPERADEVERLIQRRGLRCRRSSRDEPGDGVLLVDRLGELRRLYAIATVTFVGGSIAPRGGHNLLEPAILGKPILTGPYLENTRDVADALVREGALQVVRRRRDLAEAVRRLLADPAEAARRGQAARRVAASGAGAVRRHVEAIVAMLGAP